MDLQRPIPFSARQLFGIRRIHSYMEHLYTTQQQFINLARRRGDNNARDQRLRDLRGRIDFFMGVIDELADDYGISDRVLEDMTIYMQLVPDFPDEYYGRPHRGESHRLEPDSDRARQAPDNPPVARERLPISQQPDIVQFISQTAPDYNPRHAQATGTVRL
jgi:hypothetical protein